MKIGILQAGHLPDEMQRDMGDYDVMYARFLDGQGFDIAAWNVVDLEFPASPDEADGWLISGSKHGAYEDLPFIPKLEEFIRQTYDADVPLVGICFGHQIIAQALGGKVEKFTGGWSIGNTTYDWDGEDVTANAWHQDQVVKRPDDAALCASNDFCENAALIYGRKAFTMQPHPEFESDAVAALAKLKAPGVVPDALVDRAKAKLSLPNHNQKLALMIAQFFKTRAVA